MSGTFQNVEADIERWLDKHGKGMMGEEKRAYDKCLKVKKFFPGSYGLGQSYTADEARNKLLEVTVPASKQRLVEMLTKYNTILTQLPGEELDIDQIARELDAVEKMKAC